MEKTAEEILLQVISKLDEMRAADDSSRANINILSILDKETDEVVMCKVLWAILDYKSGGRRIYLGDFVCNVLGIEIPESGMDGATVYREYCIPNNSRRIDLVIKTKERFIPIEAKIYAGDQSAQCADYLSYARNFCDEDDLMLYYLTADRHSPSYYSLAGDQRLMSHIKLISWGDVLSWLLTIKGMNKDSEEIIGQYCKALEILLNRRKAGVEMKIDELIDSADGMRAAMEIERSIDRKKTALLHTIFEEIIEKTKDEQIFNYDPVLNEPWDYKKGLNEYYSRRRSSSTYPALTYNLGLLDSSSDGTEHYFILRFEIEWRPYVGFAIMRRNKDGELFTEDKPSDELIAKVKSMVVNPDQVNYSKDWWLYWEYITSNNQDATENEPDFRTMNDAYLALYDKKDRDAFVDQVLHMLKKFRLCVK